MARNSKSYKKIIIQFSDPKMIYSTLCLHYHYRTFIFTIVQKCKTRIMLRLSNSILNMKEKGGDGESLWKLLIDFPSSSWPRGLNSINSLTQAWIFYSIFRLEWTETTRILITRKLDKTIVFLRCSTLGARWLLFYCVNLDISDYY